LSRGGAPPPKVAKSDRGGKGPAAKPVSRPKPEVRRAAKVVTAAKGARGKNTVPRGTAGLRPTGSVRQSAVLTSEVRAEPALSRQDVEQFRQMLLDKRVEILGDVSTLHNEALDKDRRDAAGDLSSMPIHMADLGSDNYELEFTLGLIEGERAILREIDEALERIRQGTYGLCLATGKPIGKARLKAKPWAKYCYEYTLAQEQGQGRRI
jgi:RNA polymerase-binding protein DksA